MNKSLLAAALVGGLCLGSFAAHADGVDETFVEKVFIANFFEIESSKIALDKSKKKNIREFAARMVKDHSSAAEKLNAALAESAVKVKHQTQLEAKHQKALDKLKLTPAGDDFDAAYSDAQAEGHDDAVALFNAYVQNGTDSALLVFAKEMLPILESHQKHIHELKKDRL